MSNHQNNNGNSLQQGAGEFQPVSEQEQMHITGGGAAAKPNVCKDDEYWDPVSNLCVKKDKPSVAAM